MLFVPHKQYGLVAPSIWFAAKKLQAEASPLLLFLKALPVPARDVLPKGFALVSQTEQKTLFTSLRQSEEALFSRMNATCRNSVRQSESVLRDRSWQHKAPDRMELPEADLVHRFLCLKGLEPLAVRHGIMESPLLPYWLASSLRRDGRVMIVHTYIADQTEGIAFLYWSAAEQVAGEERNMLGKLNRWLHWQDILWFKRNGFTVYDWGGAGEEPEVANITRFKQSFGGEPFVRYNAVACRSVIAPVVRLLWKHRVSIVLRRRPD